MEHKKAKNRDGGGLYIAICCCILVIALIGYANNLAEKNKEAQLMPAEEAGENIIAPEAEVPAPLLTPQPTAEPTIMPERTAETVTPAPVAKSQPVEEAAAMLTPVSGNILCEFSANKQVYHSSLDDWRTHDGIDLSCTVGDSVVAAADGVVKDIYTSSLGNCLCIDHGDALMTIYANLDEAYTVSVGDNVKKGDVIAHVGNSSLGDMASEPHLHFEVILDKEYKNPVEYLQ